MEERRGLRKGDQPELKQGCREELGGPVRASGKGQ